MRWRRAFLGLLVLVLAAAVVLPRLLGTEAIRTALERQLTAYFGAPVHIGSVRATLLPRPGLDVRDVTIGSPAGVTLEEIRLETGLRPLFSRTIAGAEVVVTGGRFALPLAFPLGAAPANAPGRIPGSGFAFTSIRRIELRDLILAGTGGALTIDLDAAAAGDRLDIHRVTARGGVTRLQGTGALTSISRLEGEFELAADPLDLAEMIAVASGFTAGSEASAPARDAGRPSTLHLLGKVRAGRGRFKTIDLSDIAATVEIASGRVSLDPLSVTAFGGRFRGSVAATVARSAPELRVQGHLDGLDVAALLKASRSTGGVTGRLGGAIALTAAGTEPDALVRSARGSMEAMIRDGSMPRLDMVRTIVLAFGKPSGAPPPGSGASFSRLGGRFAVASGALSSEDLVMSSRDFDVAGRGTLQIASGKLDASGDVLLSGELTAQAGADLRRYAQEDGRVVIPARVRGTLQDPAISLDLAAVTRRALENELRRRARSLLDRLLERKD